MKKRLPAILLVLLLAVIFVFVFVACDDTDDNKNNDSNIEDTDVPLTPPPPSDSCLHENPQHRDAVSATCTGAGHREVWYCSDCKKYFSDATCENETTLTAIAIAPKGHTYGTWIDEESANCTEPGTKGHYHCNACNSDFDADKKLLENLVINALGHNYGNFVPAKEAVGCEDGNLAYYYCDVCDTYFDEDKVEYQPFPIGPSTMVIKAPHNIHFHKAEDETCTEDGHEAYWQCDDCHKYFLNETSGVEVEEPMSFEALGHDFADEFTTDVEPTCTTAGSKSKHCSRCEAKSEVTSIDALNHDIIPHEAKSATCTEIGWDAYDTCSRCDYTTYSEISALGHDFDTPMEYIISGELAKDEYGIKGQFVHKCKRFSTNVNKKCVAYKLDEDAGTENNPYQVISSKAIEGALKLRPDDTVYIKIADTTSTFKGEIGFGSVQINRDVVFDLNNLTLLAQATKQCLFTISEGANVTIKNGTIKHLNNKTTGSILSVNAWFLMLGDGESNSRNIVNFEDIQFVAVANYLGSGIQIGRYNDVTFTNCTMNQIYDSSTKTVQEGAGAKYGIVVYGESSLTMKNCNIATTIAGISGNGTVDADNKNYGENTVIVLNNTDITAPHGIYHPQVGGTLTINGGTITSSDGTAVEVRSGTVNINGATLIGTTETFGATANGNGTTVIGAALAVSQHSTNADINVTVDAKSTLTGYYAIYEKDLMNDVARDKIAITVAEGATLNGRVYSQNCANLYTTVATETELIEAINDVKSVLLTADIDVTAKTRLALSKTIIIDLNSHTLSGYLSFAVYDGADVTLRNGNVGTKKYAYTNANNESANASDFFAIYGGKVDVDKVKMIGNACSGITVHETAVVNIKNSVIKSNVYPFSTNASSATSAPIVNIENSQFYAIYTALLFNVNGTLNVTNSEFYACNYGIILRAGTANLTGCVLKNNVNVETATYDEITTKPLTEVGCAVTPSATNWNLSFNDFYNEDCAWGQGTERIPLNALVVGNKNGNYASSAVCNLVGTEVIDGFVGVLAETGKAEDFTHYAIYAINDNTKEGSVAQVNYDAKTAEKSNLTAENVRADRDATIALATDEPTVA